MAFRQTRPVGLKRSYVHKSVYERGLRPRSYTDLCTDERFWPIMCFNQLFLTSKDVIIAFEHVFKNTVSY